MSRKETISKMIPHMLGRRIKIFTSLSGFHYLGTVRQEQQGNYLALQHVTLSSGGEERQTMEISFNSIYKIELCDSETQKSE